MLHVVWILATLTHAARRYDITSTCQMLHVVWAPCVWAEHPCAASDIATTCQRLHVVWTLATLTRAAGRHQPQLLTVSGLPGLHYFRSHLRFPESCLKFLPQQHFGRLWSIVRSRVAGKCLAQQLFAYFCDFRFCIVYDRITVFEKVA